jgi:glycosyltransferase involved in cell wall biosynthesis
VKVFLAGTNFDPAYGGPAYSVSRLAAALAQCGVEVGLWAPDGSAATTSLLLHDSGVRRLRGTELQALEAFGKPDVLHDNGLWMPHNHRLCRIAASRAIPRVVSTRGMLEPWAVNHKWLKKRTAWWIYQRMDLKRAAVHHATAETEAKNLSRLGLGVPVRLIPNGVDLPSDGIGRRAEVTANGNRVRTALFVGRIYPVKGLPMLVEAWARVLPEGWRLQIVGPDEAGHRLVVEKAIAAAGLEHAISFSGPLDGAAKAAAFGSADLFVLPTHSESFGMAIAEALAHGLPVLTTTGAPWPALSERACGWRVDPTVEGLEFGLRSVSALDSGTLAAMGRAGRDFVASEYRWNLVAARFGRLYEEISGRVGGVEEVRPG